MNLRYLIKYASLSLKSNLNCTRHHQRSLSTKSAIDQSLRKSRSPPNRTPRTSQFAPKLRDHVPRPQARPPRHESRQSPIERNKRPSLNLNTKGKGPRANGNGTDWGHISSEDGAAIDSRRTSSIKPPRFQSSTRFSPAQDQAFRDPIPLSYSTSASQFLYGASVVAAALKINRRKIHKLYVQKAVDEDKPQSYGEIQRLAIERRVPVENMLGEKSRTLDKMSAGRPHNGFILEASPLPRLPLTGLGEIDRDEGVFHVALDHQSAEEMAINGSKSIISYDASGSRYPFMLVLDGILDPGNLGGILRTAFYLGVDGIALATSSTAPISPVSIKASAGASEAIPIFSVKQNGKFLDSSKRNGWEVFVADTPNGYQGRLNHRNARFLTLGQLGSPLRDHPCLLVLGSEERGLFPDIKKKADRFITIEGFRAGQAGVESLNVSVAAGLLCNAFLHGSGDISMPSLDAENAIERYASHRLF